MERTLIIVKPDGIQRGLAGAIVGRFEQRGLQIVGLKFMHVSRETAQRHYAEHEGKPFYEGLVNYITACPVVVGVLQGPDAVAVTRATMGSTKPVEASPGTIRGDYGNVVGRNLIHGSDSVASAEREIALFFRADELFEYGRSTDPWIREEPLPPV